MLHGSIPSRYVSGAVGTVMEPSMILLRSLHRVDHIGGQERRVARRESNPSLARLKVCVPPLNEPSPTALIVSYVAVSTRLSGRDDPLHSAALAVRY
jgi:hypothetical protein